MEPYVLAAPSGWYRPSVQSLHDVALLDVAYSPIPQDLQLVEYDIEKSYVVAASRGWYRPAVQAEHTAAL